MYYCQFSLHWFEFFGYVVRPAFPAVPVPCEPCWFPGLSQILPSPSRVAASAVQCCLKHHRHCHHHHHDKNRNNNEDDQDDDDDDEEEDDDNKDVDNDEYDDNEDDSNNHHHHNNHNISDHNDDNANNADVIEVAAAATTQTAATTAAAVVAEVVVVVVVAVEAVVVLATKIVPAMKLALIIKTTAFNKHNNSGTMTMTLKINTDTRRANVQRIFIHCTSMMSLKSSPLHNQPSQKNRLLYAGKHNDTNNIRIQRCNSRFFSQSPFCAANCLQHVMILIIFAFKGAIRDFFHNLLFAPRTVSNMYVQVAHAQLCANHMQHIQRLSCAACHVTCHVVWRDSSATKADRV